MTRLTFKSELQRDKDGTWWFLHVPKRVRGALGIVERRGMIPVVAEIGATRWNATLMPWADGISTTRREHEGA